jgi:hypothetical protein
VLRDWGYREEKANDPVLSLDATSRASITQSARYLLNPFTAHKPQSARYLLNPFTDTLTAHDRGPALTAHGSLDLKQEIQIQMHTINSSIVQ